MVWDDKKWRQTTFVVKEWREEENRRKRRGERTEKQEAERRSESGREGRGERGQIGKGRGNGRGERESRGQRKGEGEEVEGGGDKWRKGWLSRAGLRGKGGVDERSREAEAGGSGGGLGWCRVIQREVLMRIGGGYLLCSRWPADEWGRPHGSLTGSHRWRDWVGAVSPAARPPAAQRKHSFRTGIGHAAATGTALLCHSPTQSIEPPNHCYSSLHKSLSSNPCSTMFIKTGKITLCSY